MRKKKGKSRAQAALAPWIEARRRFRLSNDHVQMARELGMNPKTLGKLANHKQEPWKAPLPRFIEELYLRRFGRARPERSLSLEARAREIEAKERERRGGRSERPQTLSERTILELMTQGEEVDHGVQHAVRQALIRHKKLGESVAVWQDGKAVILPPEEIPF